MQFLSWKLERSAVHISGHRQAKAVRCRCLCSSAVKASAPPAREHVALRSSSVQPTLVASPTTLRLLSSTGKSMSRNAGRYQHWRSFAACATIALGTVGFSVPSIRRHRACRHLLTRYQKFCHQPKMPLRALLYCPGKRKMNSSAAKTLFIRTSTVHSY